MSKDSLRELAPKATIHHNLSIDSLIQLALDRGEVKRAKNGAIVVITDKYTGRSPDDRFIVRSQGVEDTVDWSEVNRPISEEYFDKLHKKILQEIEAKERLFVFDGFAGADKNYRLNVRVISEFAYQSLFARHMFRRMEPGDEEKFEPEFTVLAIPSCLADPEKHGTNSEGYIILHLEKKLVLIGGTKYCGEIKKSIFSAMNYLLPEKNILPMHCSANVGRDGRSALFFGLSGTGKTTLSSDPNRQLIGDDEHGWSENGIFNFEGGCYAKCIGLTREKEPQIWDAIKHGTLLENVVLKEDGELDFDDDSLTENTRAAYPIDYIKDAILEGKTGHPSAVIFLTADAFGVLPPVARLDEWSAMYHFLSGYTSKLAGTERGLTEPKATFSACFGSPFMPRPANVYAELLKQYIKKNQPEVYLVNTGWFGGPYGTGSRIKLEVTRKIIDGIMNGNLKKVEWERDELFNLEVVKKFEGISDEVFSYSDAWESREEYKNKARELARLFRANFEKKFPKAEREVLNAGPKA